MDPNTRPSHEAELPTPQPGFPKHAEGVNPNSAPNTVSGEVPVQTENHNMELPAAPAPAMPMPTMGLSQGVPSVPGPPVSSTPLTSTQVLDDTLAAEDSDLIEKEWVLKAKKIVDQTRYDPYSQNKEINKVKADYIKKRYNKDIKVGEE